MPRMAPALLAVALAAAASAGCVMYPGTARPATFDDLRRQEGWILLESVPFVAQASEQDCGAACLAMVLGHWGLPSRAEALEKECAVAGEEGIRASALREAAKRRGLAAYVFRGRIEDLAHELSRGRPLVVGLAKPYGRGFTSHFEVVVGLHPARQRIATLDPAAGLLCDSFDGFTHEWSATKEVTLVVFRSETNAGPSKPGGE